MNHSHLQLPRNHARWPARLGGLGLVLFAGLALAALQPAIRGIPPQTTQVVQQGQLLIAGRGMQDPRFRRSVIYVLRHDGQGTLGLVINRPTEVLLSHALPDLKHVGDTPHHMFYGGPVLPGRLWILFRHSAPPEHAEFVQDDIHFSGLQAVLETLLAEDLDETRLRVYFGHAGWAAGQLAHELKRGDWHVVDSSPPQVFMSEPAALWPQLIEQLDPPGRLTCGLC